MSMAQDQENDPLSFKIEPDAEQYYQEQDVDVEEHSSSFHNENQGEQEETDFFIQNHGYEHQDYAEDYSYSCNSTQPGTSRSFLKTYSAALHSPIQGVINRKFSYLLFQLC
jgi:hypothetical protein